MKAIYFLLIFTSSHSYAVLNDFWQAKYKNNISIDMRLQEFVLMDALSSKKLLTSDCEYFSKQVASFKDISPNLFNDLRHLPLKNTLAKEYEVIFQVPFLAREMQNNNLVSLNLQKLQNFKTVFSENSFSALSQKLKLSNSLVDIQIKTDFLYLSFKGRDILCDFLNHQVSFEAKVPYKIYLDAESIAQASESLARVAQVTQQTLSAQFNNHIKAALIGYRLNEIFILAETPLFFKNKKMNYWFGELFIGENFNLSDAWKNFADKKFIEFSKYIESAPDSINFIWSENEQKIN